MKLEDLISYQDVQTHLNGKRTKHLLFGNGFSIAYNSDIFSYTALSKFIENIEDDLIKKLFSSLNTKNFELIMQQLDNFCLIASIFSSDKDLVTRINNASEKLKTSLIDAVKELHPEHVFTIPEGKSRSCYSFLESYLSSNGYVFSTNYDLLLYWVLIRNKSVHAIDGFGRDSERYTEEFRSNDIVEYSELRWGKYKREQTIFYLHGTLPLFDTGVDIIKEEYDSNHYLLDKVKQRMERKEYPIFVTAGDSREKLTHIMHNKYLSFCYDKLSSIEGSLITFGFNFGDYDAHIIDAINNAAHFGKKVPNRLWSVYIGVYSDADMEHINRIKQKIKCKVTLYNAKTVNIWGDD